MVASIHNLNTNQTALETSQGHVVSTEDIQTSEASKLPDTEPSRGTGKSLAQEMQELPKVQELKSLPVLHSAANFVKKNTARLFNLGGFVGASLSIMTYFLFNLRSLAMLIGVPTAMAFYIAHNLRKSAKEDATDFSINPKTMLQETINNPGLLETNLNKVLQAMEQIKDMKNTDPKKTEGIELIEKLNLIVDSKLTQVKDFEDSVSIAVQYELERFKVSYEEMRGNLSEPELSATEALHKATEKQFGVAA